MKRIEKAVLKQSIQRPSSQHALRSDATKTGLCVSDSFFEEQGTKAVIDLLTKYIVFKDFDQHYWIDRLWYFDVEQYQKDLNAFGIPVAIPVYQPLQKLETIDEFKVSKWAT